MDRKNDIEFQKLLNACIVVKLILQGESVQMFIKKGILNCKKIEGSIQLLNEAACIAEKALKLEGVK